MNYIFNIWEKCGIKYNSLSYVMKLFVKINFIKIIYLPGQNTPTRRLYVKLEENMKKKIMALMLAATCVLSLAGCGKKASVKTEGKVTIGQYKGLNVQKSTAEITDKELQDYIDSVCKNATYTESVTEGTLEKDMSVKVDYVSTINGEEYTGGTQTGAVITLSDNGFKVDGVVDALIGKKVGDVVKVDTKYADDYSDSTLAGKDVHFEVTIKSIQKSVVPEYNDAFVEKNYKYLGYTTTAELTEYLKKELKIQAIIGEIWTKVVENATVDSYDSDELKDLTAYYKEYQESYIYYLTGYDLSAYLAAIGKTEDDYNNEMEDAAKSELKEKMVVRAIAEQEGITISDEEYNTELKKMATYYGYDTVEEYSSAYSDEYYDKDYYVVNMLANKVQEIIADSAVVVDDYETTTAEGETTEEATTEDATEK